MLLKLVVSPMLLGLAATAAFPVRTEVPLYHLVHQFGAEAWVENIAIRSNGKLLVTMIAPYPQVYQLDPFSPEPTPELIATFPSHLAALGIDEIQPDVFAVVANNFTLATVGSVPGSNTIYRVDMRSYDAAGKAEVSVLAEIPDAVFLNGFTTVTGVGKALITDSFKGQILELDTTSGTSMVWLDDSILHYPEGAIALGVNGVRYHNDGFVYFSVTTRGVIARAPYQPCRASSSHIAPKIEVLATANTTFDDIVVARNGVVFATGGPANILYKVRPGSGQVETVLGSTDSLLLAGVTAGMFGRTEADRHILYLTTDGGVAAPINGTQTEPGKVVGFDTKTY